MSTEESEPKAEQHPVTREISGLTDLERLTENPPSYNVQDYHLTPLSQQQFSETGMLFQHPKLPDGAPHSMVIPALPEGSQFFGIPGAQAVQIVATGDTRQPVALYQVAPADYLTNVAPPSSPNPPTRVTHHSLMKAEHRHSRATRRGPMDEMRQLVRILVKLIPSSLRYLSVTDEGGGGNRVSEEQIKEYLKQALGEAPQPEWGLPQGWGAYLSELFTWATDRPITKEQAMLCARRLPGRSWEAVDDALQKIGITPATWPLPLTKAGVLSAKTRDPAVLALPAPPAPLKNDVDFEGAEHKAKRRKVKPGMLQSTSSDGASLTEMQYWHQALQCLEQAILYKHNTTPPESQDDLQRVKDSVRRLLSVSDNVALRTDAVPHARISTGTPVSGNMPNMGGISVQPVYWGGADQRGPITGLSPMALPAPPEVLTQMQQVPGPEPGTTISYMPMTSPQPTTTAMLTAAHMPKSNPVVMHVGAPAITLPQAYVQHLSGFATNAIQAQMPAAPVHQVQVPAAPEQDAQQYPQAAGAVEAQPAPLPTMPPSTSAAPQPTDAVPPTSSPTPAHIAPRPAQRKDNLMEDPLEGLRSQLYGSIDQKASAPPNRLAPNATNPDPHGPPLFQTPGTYTAVTAVRPKETAWMQPQPAGAAMPTPATAVAWAAAMGAAAPGYAALPGSYAMPVMAMAQQPQITGVPSAVEPPPAAHAEVVPTPMETTAVPEAPPPAPVEESAPVEVAEPVQAAPQPQPQPAYYDATGQPLAAEQPPQFSGAVTAVDQVAIQT